MPNTAATSWTWRKAATISELSENAAGGQTLADHVLAKLYLSDRSYTQASERAAACDADGSGPVECRYARTQVALWSGSDTLADEIGRASSDLELRTYAPHLLELGQSAERLLSEPEPLPVILLADLDTEIEQMGERLTDRADGAVALERQLMSDADALHALLEDALVRAMYQLQSDHVPAPQRSRRLLHGRRGSATGGAAVRICAGHRAAEH